MNENIKIELSLPEGVKEEDVPLNSTETVRAGEIAERMNAGEVTAADILYLKAGG